LILPINHEILNPIDQFEIRNLVILDAPLLANTYISITNIVLYLTVGTLIVLAIKSVSTNYNKISVNN
jgi:F-type H+-transporting ATPase subunit a